MADAGGTCVRERTAVDGAGRAGWLRSATACALVMLSALPWSVHGQTATIVLDEDFEAGLNGWTVTAAGGDAGVSAATAASPTQSMYVRWNTVTVTSPVVDLGGNIAANGAYADFWIRRGDPSFSEYPEAGENLVVQYLSSGNTWVTLETFPGGGISGEIYTRRFTLPSNAAHSGFRLRVTLTTGTGGSGPGTNFDFWHVDDVRVGAFPGSTGGSLGLGTCDDFESGLGGWVVTAAGGSAGTSAVTSSSPSNSLFTRGGPVTVESLSVDLSGVPGAGVSSVDLDLWIRRGADTFSENPDAGENLVVEYLTSGGSWALLETLAGGGTPGEFLPRSYALPANAYHGGFRVRVRQIAGNVATGDYWHVDDVCLSGSAPVLYSFEEDSWTGAPGEIEDANGSGLNGTVFGSSTNDDANPALATNPGTCRYGVFDGVDDYVEFADDPAFDLSAELTVSAWVYMETYPTELHTIVSKDWNYEFHINAAGRVYWWWNDPSGNVRSFTTNQSIALNRWYHIAITYTSGRQVIYVDGAPWASAANLGGMRLNDLPMYIGTDWNFISRAFDGFIDEVQIAAREYSQSEVQALRDATHPCATAAAQFTINHDTFGIHCLPETIIVDVIDSVAGTPLNSYNARIRLDTQSGNGTWSLVAGNGVLTDTVAGDGVALYDWPLGESQAQFSLDYPAGPPVIDIDVFQDSDPGIRDTDAEGPLTFSPAGFAVTSSPLSEPPGTIIPLADPQTAAVPFTAHITAYGQTPGGSACGVIDGYTGNKNVKFWSDYVNPGTGFLAVDVDGVAAATSEGAAVGRVVAFVNGRASVTLKYKDAGRIRLSAKDDTTTNAELPSGITGATAAFVSRPADFVLSDIRAAAGSVLNPEAAGAGGPVFIAAGAPFRATVTALDAEGDATPNFGRETVAASVELEAMLVAPATGRSPGVVAAAGFAGFSGGVSTGMDFSWAEVGIMQLRPSVSGGDYLGSGDVVGTDSPNVGRFVPDHFALAPNDPEFATACTAGPNDFTYAGQPFSYRIAPTLTATAMSVGGSLTENYTGAFFRMTDATLANRIYSAAAGTLDTTLVPALADDIDVTEQSPGIASIRFDAPGTTELSFSRATIEAPFDAAISLSIDVLDLDGVQGLGNPFVFEGDGSGIDFDGGRQIRYGRLRFVNAVGSELVDLPVPLTAEHFAGVGTGFVPNTDDACTTGVTLAFLTYTGNLNAGETCVRDSGSPGESGIGCAVPALPGLRYAEPPVAGDFGLRLAAPGAGNGGSVIIDSMVPAWLRFDWNAALPGDENPAGIAAFGLYGGEGGQIYLRELF